MKFRVIVCSALVAVIAVVPTASARPAHVTHTQHVQVAEGGIATGVATSIAAEIAKEGIKAAVAKWAPDYYKYVDPTGALLQQISAQLAEINAKLTQLIDHQRALGERLSCESQRTALGSTLSDIQTWYAELRRQGDPTIGQSSRQLNLDDLFAQRTRMESAQHYLHNALIGNNLPNLLRSCAKHLEETEAPFLSAHLEAEVWNFWSLYRTAAAELLVVRANMIALHPERFSATAAEHIATTVINDWASERSLIKPAFPDYMSYDTQSKWLWRYDTIPYGHDTLRKQLEASNWHVTGFSTIPTCSAVEAEFKKSGSSGDAAIRFMRDRRIVNIPWGYIICYDDHDRLHEFNMVTYSYRYAGDVQSYAPSVAARPNEINGQFYVRISDFSYIH
jgi:hypothetical protein